MASTVLKTTIRNLYREKIYAMINISRIIPRHCLLPDPGALSLSPVNL